MRTAIKRKRRQYTHCAKGGHKAHLSPGNYVCGEHAYPNGLYTHCAVCGGPMGKPSRSWVHLDCQAGR